MPVTDAEDRRFLAGRVREAASDRFRDNRKLVNRMDILLAVGHDIAESCAWCCFDVDIFRVHFHVLMR